MSFFQVLWTAPQDGIFTIDLGSEQVGTRITALTRVARAQGPPVRIRTPIQRPTEGVRTIEDYLWADGTLNLERFARHLRQLQGGSPIHHFRPRTHVAAGPDLVDREGKLAELTDLLQRGSCHLRAPRRYGKTSLLRRLAEELPAALRVDLSEVDGLRELAAKLLREALRVQAAASALRRVRPALALWGEAGVGSAAQEATIRALTQSGDDFGLVEELLGALADAGVVLLLDEFSLFLRGLENRSPVRLAPFLDACSALRTRDERPLRWVVAGSTGLSGYVRLMGLEQHLADLTAVDVPPLSGAPARILVEELLYGAGKQPASDVPDALVERVGESAPYFLHALASEAIDEVGARRAVTVDDIERAYQQRLLGSAGGEYFKPFRVDGRPYPDALRRVAAGILRAIARSRGPLPGAEIAARYGVPSEHIDSWMTCLEEDYDLVREETGWRMRSPVLAERWRRMQGGA